MNKTIYNFSAGPGKLPTEVLCNIKKDFLNWNNIGSSIIEISHRSKEFYPIIQNSEKDLRDLLNIPEEYAILFCQGGARGQFSSIPMNLAYQSKYIVDYIDSGYWSYNAMLESRKYCNTNHINVQREIDDKKYILKMNQWNIHSNSYYIHYCPNETINGTSIHEEPNFQNKVIVADFSSFLFSKIIDITKYDLIYASAQKNIGPSGITIVIIKKTLLNINNNIIPSILNYKIIFNNQSMFNTPVTFSWYVISLVLKWMKKKGGVKFFDQINYQKSSLLYNTIDNSNFYINNIHSKNRSLMNVTFDLYDKKLNSIFLKESNQYGLKFLKGHTVVGGFRASIYNAMPIEGIYALIKFMNYFEKKYG